MRTTFRRNHRKPPAGRRLTYANVTATLALVVALGGGSAWAAHHYLITSASQIKPSVLKKLHGANGKNGANGTTGASGPQGAKGDPGSAVAYGAFVGSSTGVTISGPVRNLSAGNVSRAGAGAYCFSGLSFTPNNVVATLDSSYTSGFVTASTTPFGPCPAGTQAEVKTFDAAGTPADRSFSVLFN